MTRTVNKLSTIRVGSARYSVPTALRGTRAVVLAEGPKLSQRPRDRVSAASRLCVTAGADTRGGYLVAMTSPMLTREVPADPERLLCSKVRDEVACALEGPALAVMVYGSQARGSADAASDIDVLQVVSHHSGSYKVGRVAVTAYTPAHLHAMAKNGSLFVRHLREEGVLLFDHGKVLARALAAYECPSTYVPLTAELRAAAEALAVEYDEFKQCQQAMGRLGIYLLRSALYVEAVKSDSPTFDVDLAAKGLGHQELGDVLALRRSVMLSSEDALRIRSAVLSHFGIEPHHSSLANLAVKWARTRPHASALIAQVLSSADELDYAGLPLPPL